jgi:hypothetical protein
MICDAGFSIRLAPLLGLFRKLRSIATSGLELNIILTIWGNTYTSCRAIEELGAAGFRWTDFQKVSPTVFFELNAHTRFFFLNF